MALSNRFFLFVFAILYIVFVVPFIKSGLLSLSSILQGVTQQTYTISTPSSDTKNTTSSNLSRNWSGYVSGSGTYTGVSASWKVPNPKVSQGDFGVDAEWIGIGGVTNTDLIQAGTQGVVDNNGNLTYEAFYETLPDPLTPVFMDVSPGDSMSVSVTQKNATDFAIDIKNKTNGQSVNLTIPYDSSLSSAEWITEAPSGIRRVLPLDNFGTVQFTDATAMRNGQSINVSQSGARAVTMGTIMGTLATASPLNNDGSGFSVKYSDNAAQNQAAQNAFFGSAFGHRFVFRFGD